MFGLEVILHLWSFKMDIDAVHNPSEVQQVICRREHVARLEHFVERVEGRVQYDPVHSGQPLLVELGHGARGHPGPHGVPVDNQFGIRSDGVPTYINSQSASSIPRVLDFLQVSYEK